MSLKDRLRLKLKVKTLMYGYNAGQPMAIPIYTVLPYCVIVVMVFSVWDMYRTRAVCTSEGGTIPCTVKAMRQLTCTNRLCKATARLASAPEYSTYCTLPVQHKVPYARCLV